MVAAMPESHRAFLSSYDLGKMVIHGHTPVREPEMRYNRINIDTGAYAMAAFSILSITEVSDSETAQYKSPACVPSIPSSSNVGGRAQ
jgi:hypothetical protein